MVITSRHWNGVINYTILNKHTFAGTILVEQHGKGCPCSHCTGEYKLHYGLNIPKAWKKWNSWYTIKLFNGIHIRWTNHWLKKFEKKKNEKI